MRSKGMINRVALFEVANALNGAIHEVVSLLNTYLPKVWPPFEVLDGGFYHEADYDRNGNTGHGHGLSRECSQSAGYAAWAASSEDTGAAWQDWRALGYPGLTQPFDRITVEGILDTFGHGHKGYDREHWKAGSVDREAFDSTVGNLVRSVLDSREILHPLLVVTQLGQSTSLLSFQVWDWMTYTGFAESTLEVFAGRFAWDSEAAARCPHVPNLPERIWDGFAAEMLARRKLAAEIISAMQYVTTDGAQRTVGEHLIHTVKFWHSGSQTRQRGP